MQLLARHDANPGARAGAGISHRVTDVDVYPVYADGQRRPGGRSTTGLSLTSPKQLGC